MLPIQRQKQQQQPQQQGRRNRIRRSFHQQQEIDSLNLNATTKRQRQYQQRGYNNTRETYECSTLSMKHHAIVISTTLVSTTKVFWNKLMRIRHLPTMVGLLVVVLHLSSMMIKVTGHWIDPDTPNEAYTTVPIPAHQYYPPYSWT